MSKENKREQTQKQQENTKEDTFYEKSGEGIVVSCRDDCVAVDLSNGSKSVYSEIADGAAYLKAYGIDRLYITNPHKSHAGYIRYITDEIKLSAVYMPDEEDSRTVAELMPEGIEIVYYSQGDIFELDGYRLITYEDVYISRSVVPVVRLKIESEEKSFFYLGAAAEEAGVSPENSDYILVGSYGPKYKSIPSLDYEGTVFTFGAFDELYGIETGSDSRTINLYKPEILLKFLN